jgi:putative MFS transporter
MMASYTTASLTIPFLTKVLPNWKYLAIIAALPNLIVIAMYKWVPESPSWLLCNGKIDEAKEILTFMAKVNKKDARVSCMFVCCS